MTHPYSCNQQSRGDVSEQHDAGHGRPPTMQRRSIAPRPVDTIAKRAIKILALIIGGLILVGVLSRCGGGGVPVGNKGDTTPTTFHRAPAVAAVPTLQPGASPTAAAPVAVLPPAPTGPVSTFGPGTYLVGEDITPGKYRSPGVTPGAFELCYWDVQDDDGKILDQGVAAEGPSRTPALKQGRTFKTSGCEPWVLA